MGLTALSGPFVQFGLTQGSTGQVQEYNSERGPGLFDLGHGVLDPRYQFNYRPGSPVGTLIFGFLGQRAQVDFVPMTAQTSAIVVSSANTPVAGTALTLTTAASGIGTYATTIIAPETGKATGTLIAIDSTAAYLTFGSGNAGATSGSTSGTIALWNPAAGAGRTIQFTLSSSGQDTGSITVAGRDVYGFKMTEVIAIGSTVVSSFGGQKAFKYVSGVTPSSSCTIVSTGIGVGFTDVFGLPLLCKYLGVDTTINLVVTVSSIQTAKSTGAVTLGTTVTQVSTSIDPRGTYVSTTASNNTIRLQMTQIMSPSAFQAVTPSDTSLLFGATQSSSV